MVSPSIRLSSGVLGKPSIVSRSLRPAGKTTLYTMKHTGNETTSLIHLCVFQYCPAAPARASKVDRPRTGLASIAL